MLDSKICVIYRQISININTLPRGIWYSFRFFNTLFMQVAKRAFQSYRMSKHFIKEFGRHIFVFVRFSAKK